VALQRHWIASFLAMTVEGAAQSLRSSLRGGTTKQSSLAAGVAFAQVAQTPVPAFPSGGVQQHWIASWLAMTMYYDFCKFFCYVNKIL
jgi:hypothetical protein